MCWLEVRYISMVLINILKSSFIDGEAWDAFGVAGSWNKFSFLFVIIFIVSFYSIKISSDLQIQVRFHNFNLLVLLSLFFSLILPQRACWLYFLIVWLSTYENFSALIKAFIHCFEAILSKIHGYNIGIHHVAGEVQILDLESGRERDTTAQE